MAAEFQRDLVPAVAEFQSSLSPTAAEFQTSLATPAAELQGSRVAMASANPQPISNGSKDKEGSVATIDERSIERRATLMSRRVLKSADIMRLVKAKDIRVTRRHGHNLQQRGLEEEGVYELPDELDGYLSKGGQSVSVHHTVIWLCRQYKRNSPT